MNRQTSQMSDRDLLVEAITKLDGLTASFAETRAAVSTKADTARVEKLEEGLAGKAEGSLAKKVDDLQRKVYWLLGGAAAIDLVLSKIKF